MEALRSEHPADGGGRFASGVVAEASARPDLAVEHYAAVTAGVPGSRLRHATERATHRIEEIALLQARGYPLGREAKDHPEVASASRKPDLDTETWRPLDPIDSHPRDIVAVGGPVTGMSQSNVSTRLSGVWRERGFIATYRAHCPSRASEHQFHFPDLGFYVRVDQMGELKIKGASLVHRALGRSWRCGSDEPPNDVALDFDGTGLEVTINGRAFGPVKVRRRTPAVGTGRWLITVRQGVTLTDLAVAPLLGKQAITATDGDVEVATTGGPNATLRFDADGRTVTVPGSLRKLPVGWHRAEVSAEGFETSRVQFEVLPGAVTRYRGALTPVRPAEPKPAPRVRRRDVRRSQLPNAPLALAVDPVRPELLYMVDDRHGLWWSSDGGRQWTEAAPEGTGPKLRRVTPAAGGVLLGLADDGLYHSEDVGESWMIAQGVDPSLAVELAAAGESLLAVDPRDPSTYYLAAAGDLRVTRDGGRSFQRFEAPGAVLALANDPVDGSLLFAMVEQRGLMVHGRDGWTPLLPGAIDPAGLQVVRTPETPDQVLVGLADGTVLASDDAGLTFREYAEGLKLQEGETLLKLARDPIDLALVAVTDDGRLFRRVAGSPWKPIGRVHGVTALAADGIDFLSVVGNQLRVGSAGGVQELDLAALIEPARTDGGATRVMVDGQRLPAGVMGLAVDPADPTRVVALDGGGTVWSSGDGGRTFETVELPAGEAWVAVGFGGEGLQLTSERDVWDARGEGWHSAALPAGGRILASAQGSGETWILREGSLVRLRGGRAESFPVRARAKMLALAGEPWIADDSGGLFRWTGEGWEPEPMASSGTFVSLVGDPDVPDRVFLVTSGGVARYRASTGAWEPLASELLLGGVRPLALALDPADLSLYLSLSDGRLVRSIDSGTSWRPLADRLPTDVAGLAARGGALYLVAEDGAFFRLTRVLSRERLSSRVYFDIGSAGLSAAGRRALLEVAGRLDTRHVSVRVEGHTDDVGSDDVNRELSRRRAESVAAVLREFGIGADQITLAGMGSSSPIADNASEEGRARNRRVEILLVQ